MIDCVNVIHSQVFKNLKLFIKHKDPEDDLFDRITVRMFVSLSRLNNHQLFD